MKKISTLKTIVPIIITLAIVACSKNDTAVNNHQVIDLADLTADYIAQDGDILTGKLDFTNHFIKISIADRATVTLNGVTIMPIKEGMVNTNFKWAGLNCLGDATILLNGKKNTITGIHYNYPSIHIPAGKTLTISGSDSLEIRNYGYGAGIGGGWGIDCGNIVIKGGIINVIGGQSAAGIGSGLGSDFGSNCGDITICGGTVTATGGYFGTGIGCGVQGTCGNITINNDITRVTATKGELAPYCIGKNGDNSICGTIMIGGKNYGTDGITDDTFIYPVTE
jgi:hypothetical protein